MTSADAFNGYTFRGSGSVKIGGYVVVDSAVAGQHTDLDIDYVNGVWTQNIRTDAFIMGAVQSGTFSQTVLDSDEGVLFLDASTKQARPSDPLWDVLGVPAGADVWRGPESTSGHKIYLGIANEATKESTVDAYSPVGDPRAASESHWVRTDLVGFSGPGDFAAFYGGEVSFDTLDGLNGANESAIGGNPSDTFWGFAGSHAHLAWCFTAPGRYTLTFRSTVRVNGVFVTSPDTTFTFDVDSVAGDFRLTENAPLVLADNATMDEDGAPLPIDVLSNDASSADNYEVLSVTGVTQGTHGSVTIPAGAGAVVYVPNANFHGSDSFTYNVTDEHGGGAAGAVTITVNPVNDVPSFVKGANIEHTIDDHGSKTFPSWVTEISDGDLNVEQTLTFQANVISGASIFAVMPTVSASGTLAYELNGTPGVATVELRLTDDATAGSAALTTEPQTFTVTSLSAPNYTVTAIGTLGGATSSALDVNNKRQVSGNSLVTADPGSTGSLLRAYLWSNGTMTNLGAMVPIPPSTSANRFGRGYAVNDAGIVVGEFNNDSSRAFVYSGGVMSGLTRLAGGNDNGVAVDINNSNVIVGASSNGAASRPTKWTRDGGVYIPSDLGTLAGTSSSGGRAAAINERGDCAGQSLNSVGTTQATLWSEGGIVNLTSLGDGTRFSQAMGSMSVFMLLDRPLQDRLSAISSVPPARPASRERSSGTEVSSRSCRPSICTLRPTTAPRRITTASPTTSMMREWSSGTHRESRAAQQSPPYGKMACRLT
ncbi:choice-of-anchor M domain-containing protein [Verrucomicrobium spinosum]|uniref:choice-of-anchor M domain-containing protein n=1 Tax=Verrucomicrobium spinosum TaxID=2736 RepID=UPI0009467198|nr:choice-of-anchor M domain-containing protein [Verrucomicrobium spinosum]